MHGSNMLIESLMSNKTMGKISTFQGLPGIQKMQTDKMTIHILVNSIEKIDTKKLILSLLHTLSMI